MRFKCTSSLSLPFFTSFHEIKICFCILETYCSRIGNLMKLLVRIGPNSQKIKCANIFLLKLLSEFCSAKAPQFAFSEK